MCHGLASNPWHMKKGHADQPRGSHLQGDSFKGNDVCHSKYNLVGCYGFAVGAWVAAFVVLLPAVRAGEVGEGKAYPEFVQPYPPYVETWEKAKPLIDTQAVRAQVARLRSENLTERAQAIAALEALAGDRFGYAADGTPEARNEAIVGWERYAQDLDTAVNQWVPLLTATPSTHNWSARTEAASVIGRRVPHPAFLPLLRQIVANKEDRYFSNYVRIGAIKSISMIRHEGLMEYLIDQLDTDLGLRSWALLQKLTHPQRGSKEELAAAARAFTELNKHETGEDFLVLKKRYQEWWAKNKANFTYERGRVLSGG
jgi:hypothetical protein